MLKTGAEKRQKIQQKRTNYGRQDKRAVPASLPSVVILVI